MIRRCVCGREDSRPPCACVPSLCARVHVAHTHNPNGRFKPRTHLQNTPTIAAIDIAVIEATEILPDGGVVPGASAGITQEIVDVADKIIIEVSLALFVPRGPIRGLGCVTVPLALRAVGRSQRKRDLSPLSCEFTGEANIRL